MPARHWLMKSEPDCFSIDDLARNRVSGWDGVRNYQARNFMRDEMKPGDGVLFYHSSTTPPGVAGLARVKQTGIADPTQFDPESEYYDPKSDPSDPRWIMVQVEFVEKFPRLVSLEEMKADPALDGMPVLQRGQRLSVQPVEKAHYSHVRKLARVRVRR